MINHDEQLELFTLISNGLTKDVECYAFGGTAMMFYGYKDETKDIDLLFETEPQRLEFINRISTLGFSEVSPLKIYIPEKLQNKHKPLMFKKEETRFDLFVHKIFKTIISPTMKENLFAIHDFKGKVNLRINIFRKEHIVMLKAVTERDKDFEDILTIIKKEKRFDWSYFIDEVIWQYQNGDSWVLIDSQKMITELKQYIFIEKQHSDRLYKAKK